MFPNLHLKRLDPCVSARRRPAEHLACPTKPGRCVGALRRPAIALSLVLTLLMLPSSIVQANVYPTNIKVNDGFTNITATAGSSIAISYILNEPASAGVTIQLVSGGIAVRTIAIPGGASGTLRGLNQVSWDGKDNASNNAAPGTYALSITAASHGYPVWTQTTDDNTNGNVVYEGRGIAVNRNTNSPFYGRIYVSNAAESTAGQPDWLGFHVGIVKCNADASFADEGGLSTGGYPWAGDNFSPWHIAVAPNDSVYIDDFTTNGQVISWDAT
ncbi:MAG TPA: FlgD immunoglobulin-like domain containing protein, partial [Verrucomicrobiae bacterium]|nr:FlgD immunoglobulin-like domain containing protein [Verrucomicrobiae bacterium]